LSSKIIVLKQLTVYLTQIKVPAKRRGCPSYIRFLARDQCTLKAL